MNPRLAGALLLTVFFALCSGGILPGHGAEVSRPGALPGAIVVSGEARFTVLTPKLLRLEWSTDSSFEDRASLVMLNRTLPVPKFSTDRKGGWLEVTTEALQLRYREHSGKFTKENLSIRFQVNAKDGLWVPGTPDTANLRGTTRTLDAVEGATGLEPGLLSRDGWVVVDDSERPLFDGSEWPWVLPRPEGARQDLYFLGYGHAYKELLGDFVRLAGRIPMPPRFAFGTWWSRYWAYTDEELRDLVGEFRMHNVPLDVLVVDMDWHLTFDMRWEKEVRDQAGQTLGWTGYTWDRNYFPEPASFLSWCAARGLRTPLNLHPASGVQPHEQYYPEMARAMGIDPETRTYVPFDITDKKFATNYLNIMIRPLENQGVDFWWLDWQQWGTTKIAGVTPTWWLNYVFFSDMERRKAGRPLLFHRWGGLGNHRYQIGFSGDAISVWKSLAFQPSFTATAANVGFGYWSHDIGGHMPGVVSPELYTRWLQFGAFSPILRTHTTKNPDAERRIWAYPHDYFVVMRDAYIKRYALIPYIYSAARQAYDTGVSICRPMYYEYPETPEAYTFTDQYFFGDDLLVAPVATPLSADSLLATKRVWLPPGEWIEWWTGAKLTGPGVVDRSFALDEIPVYVRSGAIIPMQPEMQHTGELPVDPLILTVFPGRGGSTRVYEDEGNTDGYNEGRYAWTGISAAVEKDKMRRVVISPVEGGYPGMDRERSYEIRFPLSHPPASVTCNGKKVNRIEEGSGPGWWYDGENMATVVRLRRFARAVRVEILLEYAAKQNPELRGAPGVYTRLKRVMTLMNCQWPKEWSPEVLVVAAQTGNRMSMHPESVPAEAAALRGRVEEFLRLLPSAVVSEEVRLRARLHAESVLGILRE
jgi:alpha-glucosidase (family GH31 glycosyl hydrolase)